MASWEPSDCPGRLSAMKRFFTAASLVLLVSSCTSDLLIEDPPSPSGSASATTQQVTDYASFTRALDAAGLEIRSFGGQGLESLLGVPGHRLSVGGEGMYAHEYPSAQALLGFELSVDPTGRRLPTGDNNGVILLEGQSPIRFYSAGKLRVLYGGNDHRTLETLHRLLGPPFAGGGRRGGTETA